MRHEHVAKGCLSAIVSAVVAGLPIGCGVGANGPLAFPPVVTGAAVISTTGTFLVDVSTNVTVMATITSAKDAVESVTADLSQIGGPIAQSLTNTSGTNAWSAMVTVTPTVLENRNVTIVATDSNSLKGAASTSVTVISVPGNLLPALTNPAIAGSLAVGQATLVTISVTVSEPQGSTQVVTVDLSQIGGPGRLFLTQSGSGSSLWTGSQVLRPTTAGAFIVPFLAGNDSGQTGVSAVTVVVNATL